MGTRALLVFRVRGSIVLQVHTQGDGYPSGIPSIIAKYIMTFHGKEIVISTIVCEILSKLKDCVGSIYVRDIDAEFDTVSNWPFIEYTYIFNFSDEPLTIDFRPSCGEFQTQSFPSFFNMCLDLKGEAPPFDARMIDGRDDALHEYVTMLDFNGRPFFHMTVPSAMSEWYDVMRDAILKISLVNGLSGVCKIGDIANGMDCLAAQVLKLSLETCGEVRLLPSACETRNTTRVSTICLYPDDASPIHHVARQGVLGIWSQPKAAATVSPVGRSLVATLHKADPPMPVYSNKRKRETSDLIMEEREIVITQNMSKTIKIRVGQVGEHVFTTTWGAKMLFFKEGAYVGEWMVSHGDDRLKFEYTKK